MAKHSSANICKPNWKHEEIFLKNLVSGFHEEEQEAGSDERACGYWGQVSGEPHHGQGQVQGKTDPHLKPRQSHNFLQACKYKFTIVIYK